MRTVITGAAGYIGSYICREWNIPDQDQYDIVFSQDQNVENRDTQTRIAEGTDTIVHLAAISGVRNCYKHPGEAWRTNTRATLRLAERAKAAGVKTFIFPSSSAVYGREEGHIEESQKTRPLTVYGHTKLLAERIIELASDTFRVVILRKSNVYGTGTFRKLGTVMESFITNALNGQALFISGSGKQARNFIHIEDTAELYKEIADRPDFPSGIYNVAGPDTLTIADLAALIESWPQEIAWHATNLYYDCSKLCSVLKMRPARTIAQYIGERLNEKKNPERS